jgi:16S rRNA (cytidine1402-2'-O)-methyltransferase
VTIVVEGAGDLVDVPTDPASLAALVASDEAAGATRREAIQDVAKRTGLAKRVVYDAVHKAPPRHGPVTGA